MDHCTLHYFNLQFCSHVNRRGDVLFQLVNTNSQLAHAKVGMTGARPSWSVSQSLMMRLAPPTSHRLPPCEFLSSPLTIARSEGVTGLTSQGCVNCRRTYSLNWMTLMFCLIWYFNKKTILLCLAFRGIHKNATTLPPQKKSISLRNTHILPNFTMIFKI